LFIPERAQILHADLNLFAPQEAFSRLCREHRIECLEPHEEFIRQSARSPLYWADDMHLTPAGAELTANVISRYISEARELRYSLAQ
jgi:hypothetical protein